MRAFRICSCMLLAGALSGISGCGLSASYTAKSPEVKTNAVTITNCTATPDTAKIDEGDSLTWTATPPDGHTYAVHFPDRRPIPAADAPTATPQPITADGPCKHSFGLLWCKYGYNVIQDPNTNHSKTCQDPGVHVVPS
jgi:plastocyanin